MKLNCKSCLEDIHDGCTHDNCLCEIECDHNRPTLRGKKHWGHTEIEKEFTNYMILHFDEVFKDLMK